MSNVTTLHYIEPDCAEVPIDTFFFDSLPSFVIFITSLPWFLFLLLEKRRDTKFRYVFPVTLSSIMRDADEFQMAVNTDHTWNPLKFYFKQAGTNIWGSIVIALASASTFNACIKNLTLAITFKPLKVQLSYFICVFGMTRPFKWYMYHKFWYSDFDLSIWLPWHSHAMKHRKTVANIFQWKTLVTWRKNWHWFFRLFKVFHHISINIRIEVHFLSPHPAEGVWGGGVYSLSVQSELNLGYNFWTKRDRAFILHMCVPCDKIFSCRTKNLDLVTLTSTFDLLLKKNLTLDLTF